MHIDDVAIAIDYAAKFFGYIKISGWAHHAEKTLTDVQLVGVDVSFHRSEVGRKHDGVISFGPDKGFQIEVVMRHEGFPSNSIIKFSFSDGSSIDVSLSNLVEAGIGRTWESNSLSHRFRWLLEEENVKKMIDVGGRSRSKIDRSSEFPGIDVSVVDIVGGDNVDIVGDAHKLSKLITPGSADAFICISVIEHILMPWKLAVELNKVLKMGGIGLVHTHQTLGIHDQPWDFWRFSEYSWPALFNKSTGFEIIEAKQSLESFIIPFFWRSDKETAEKSAGYECSTVLVRKIGVSTVDWDVDVESIIDTKYPENDDGFDPEKMKRLI